MVRDSTKNILKATQTSNATTVSNLPTVSSQDTTNSQNTSNILPTVSTAIKIKATARSNPTKNNQEMVADPTVRNLTIKSIMVEEVEITTWTPARDIKSKVATKNSTKAETIILVIKGIRTREVLLKMMISKDMVDKNKVQTTMVTKVIDKTTTKAQDRNSLTKSLTTTTSKKEELRCRIPKPDLNIRKTLCKKSHKVKLPSKVSVLLKLLSQQKRPKPGLSHQLKVSTTDLWLQRINSDNQ